MNSSAADQYDAFERVIFETGIGSVQFDIDADRLDVVLTSGTVLHFKLSAYHLLRGAGEAQLVNYKLVAAGLGIHWPDLDEDLSLKGFLEEELKLAIGGDTQYAMAA